MYANYHLPSDSDSFHPQGQAMETLGSLKTPARVGAEQVAEHVEEEDPQRARGLHVHRKTDV